MALSTEDIFGLFNFDSGDTEQISTGQAGDIQEGPLITFSTEPESHDSNISSEKEVNPPVIHDITLEKNSSEELVSNAHTTNLLLDDTHQKANLLDNGEVFTKSDSIPDILASAYESVKSNKKQADKINRRVHFNSTVETFTFEPEQGINENYIEEFTIENVCGYAFNEKVIWKSESNLAFRNAQPYPDCPIMEEWLRCDRRFHQLRTGCLLIPEYSRLDDRDRTGNLKTGPRLKRTNSCFFRKKKNENENESSGSVSGSLNRRLSMSMHNLKMGTKSWIDTLWTKVTKKKEESFPEHEFSWAGDIIDVSVKEKKNKSRSTKAVNGLLRKKKSYDENFSPSGNTNIRSWKSMQNLNPKKNFTEDIIDDSGFEPSKLKRRNSVFLKRTQELENVRESADDQNRPANPVPANIGLRSCKSMQNLKLDSKSWMDKFVTKIMKK